MNSLPEPMDAIDVLPVTDHERRSSAINRIGGPKQLGSSWKRPLVVVLDTLVLTCFLAMVLALSDKPGASADEDLWWHLRTGSLIAQHHAVPVQDTFASYTMGQPWVVYTWLFDVLLWRVYDHWHLPGVLAFTGCLMLASLSALVALLSRYTALHRAVGLGMAALFGITVLAAPRPWLFTILFFIAEIYFLLKARESGRVAWLAPLVPLFALWANVHIQFVYGLAVIGLFALEAPFASLMNWGPAPNRLRARWFWAVLAVSGFATLANPYGWKLYSAALQYGTQNLYLSVIQENQPMQFRSINDWAPMLLACLAIFTLAGLKQKYPVLMLLLAMSCWLGFRTGRDVWLLAISSALILANSMSAPDDSVTRRRWIPWMTALPLSVAFGYVLLHSNMNTESALREASAARFPEKAATYIEAHALPNPLYNPLNWGGYLIWRLPGMPVSIDGRNNLHGDEHLARSVRTWLGKADWVDDPELKKARTILLDRDSPLASILRSDRRFRLVYQDEIASVFQPVS
jgi:hypothetical protein